MKRLGFMISHIFNSYSRLLLKGVQDEVSRQNALNPGSCRLIVYKGNIFRTPYNNMAHENIVYRSIGPGSVDGLLIPTNVFTTHMSQQELLPILQSYRIPATVSLGHELPGHHSVVMDPGTQLTDLVKHLIEKHGYRKLAFFTGPEGHPDSAVRFQAFQAAMEAHDLPIEPQNLLPGDFSFYNARTLLQERFATNRPPFEALVCANDEMAIEAMKFFQEKGLRIPDDLAITGLDDIEQASLMLPQLTTVREPIAELGSRAVQVALDLIDHPDQPRQVHRIPTSIKLRSSCGCLARLETHAPAAAPKVSITLKPEILAGGRAQEAFLLEFQRLIEDRIRAGEDGGQLQNHIFTLRTKILKDLAEQITPRNITDLLAEMQKIVTQLSQLVYARYQEGFEDLMRSMRAFVRMEQLVTWPEIERELERWLPTLGMRFFALVLYPKPVDCTDEDAWVFPEQARVHFAWSSSGDVELSESERSFDPALTLLPVGRLDGLPDRQRMVNVVSFAGRQFGYYIYDCEGASAMSNELFRINAKNLLQNFVLYHR